MQSRKVENWCMGSELFYGGFKKRNKSEKKIFRFSKKLLKSCSSFLLFYFI